MVQIFNEELDKIISENMGNPSALIEVLHKAQNLIGYIPREVQIKIAEGLGVSVGDVYSVVSFYSYFTDQPRGKYNIALCKGTACYVKGYTEILEAMEKEFGIKEGKTTEDGMFSLEVVRCLGACGLGPVMTVNGNVHGSLTPEKVVSILKEYRDKELKETS